MARRAILFIDGNNWYHSLREAGLGDLGRLDYVRVSEKVVGPREWVGTRYYIGRMPQTGFADHYAEQRRFLAKLGASDARISIHTGRLEPRQVDDPAAEALLGYLGALRTRIDPQVYRDLIALGRRHKRAATLVEKAVDVMIAVDMVTMATRNELDDAYLLSADGDFTPAVEAVRAIGKRVYAASPAMGARLAAVVNSFVHLSPAWFADCFR